MTGSLSRVLKERLGFYSSGSNDLLTFTCPKGKALGFLRQVLPTCSLLLVLKERLWVFFVRFYRPAGPEERASPDEIPNGAWLVSPAVEYRTHTEFRLSSLFKSCGRSEYSLACFACCEEFRLFNFCLLGSFNFTYFQISSSVVCHNSDADFTL